MTAQSLHFLVNMQPSGLHPSAWRLPHSDPRAFVDLGYYEAIAREAERGLLDGLFLADFSALQPETPRQPRWTMDPLITLAALAAATEHVGLIATISTTFTYPYQLARAVASLDHVSRGRAGWNVVTSYDPNAGRNYGIADLPDKRDRYRRAEEHIEIVKALWGSWDEEALVFDRETGVFVDTDRVHAIDHHGEFFDVAGPLQVPTTPQGRPVIFQSGGSEGGRVVAGRFADGVFSSQLDIEGAQEYRRDLRRRAEAAGRSADDIRLFPGVVVVAGETREEARAKRRALDGLPGARDARVEWLERQLGVRFADVDLDRPASPELLARIEARGDVHSFAQTAIRHLSDRSLTIREYIESVSVAHRTLIGDPAQIADSFEEWLDTDAADGFVVMFDVLPDGLRDFVDLVVPELQRRGLYRTAYEETTLAGLLGFDRHYATR